MNKDQIEILSIKEYIHYYNEHFKKNILKDSDFSFIKFKINEDKIMIAKNDTHIYKIVNKEKTVIQLENLKSQDQEFLKDFFNPQKEIVITKTPLAEPKKILKSVFGYDNFRDSQEEIINSIIQGNDNLVLMPTGGGKSLCYQIPALCLDGVAVVISPLISLMQDQVMTLKELGVNAEFINSALDKEEYIDIMKKIKDIKLLYISPEKYNSENFQSLLKSLNISFFAIDEAHCVSKWGHDFRPDYIKLNTIKPSFNKPILALTATADLNTREDIPRQLKMKNYQKFISNFDRPNISIFVENKDNYRKQLIDFLSTRKKESGIVYCLSRKKVDEITEFLNKSGFNAFAYHAGMNNADREQNQDKFIKNENVIMVATIAFGMGIDKPNVRYVVHLDMPNSIESYYQEIGRAGRDGEESQALLLYGMQDFIIRSKMNFDGESTKKMQNLAKLNEMLAFCETVSCKRNFLMDYFGNHKVSCGKCSSCLQEKDLIDMTDGAKLVLKAIKETQGYYAMGYICSFLKGSSAKKIKEKHKKLPSYGQFKGTDNELKMTIRQMIVLGIIEIDLTNDFNTLRFKKDIDEKVMIYRSNKTSKTKAKGRAIISDDDFDNDLFEKLKDCRLNLAKGKNIPPYMILHDRTLKEMAQKKPKTLKDLRDISGWGEKKIPLYGSHFLAVINLE